MSDTTNTPAPAPAPPLSRNVLVDVLRQFVHNDALPNDRAQLELANSAGVSIQEVKNLYQMAYTAAGNKGDPWGPPAFDVSG